MLSARVNAAVNSAHIAALNARLRRKNVPRTRNSTILLVGESERKSAMCEERVEVRAVVVLRIFERVVLAVVVDRDAHTLFGGNVSAHTVWRRRH